MARHCTVHANRAVYYMQPDPSSIFPRGLGTRLWVSILEVISWKGRLPLCHFPIVWYGWQFHLYSYEAPLRQLPPRTKDKTEDFATDLCTLKESLSPCTLTYISVIPDWFIFQRRHFSLHCRSSTTCTMKNVIMTSPLVLPSNARSLSVCKQVTCR